MGVELNSDFMANSLAAIPNTPGLEGMAVDFRIGHPDRIPLDDQSVNTVLAFDGLEHLMSPASILPEWHRVLRPGGRCLIEWYPYKGPWGPHMDALIPIPWAHVVFGEEAMFRAAERIYEAPDFVPRFWDLDEHGQKRPNEWRQWSSFAEQGFINQLDIDSFRRLAGEAGFAIAREDLRSFSGSLPRRAIGRAAMALPKLGEYFVSYAIIELERPIS